MGAISGWLVSILSVVIVGVLVDLMLPNGKLNGFIQAVFGFLCVVVIISPIPKLLNKEISFDDVFYNNSSTQINEDYVDATIKNIVFSLEKNTQNVLAEKGFMDVIVKIDYNVQDYRYCIEKVFLNIKKLVINSNQVHINKYTEMKQAVVNYLNVSSEEVEFIE